MKLLTLLMMIISIILAGCDTTILPTPDDEVSYTITTIAGSGAEDDEGRLATEAFLTSPRGVAVDDHGNVYVADTENHRIRKVDAESGTIATFAGTGEEGYSGDNGPATEAKLNWPTGVAVDDAGNVYIADRNNERIRRVDPEGIITTFAGTGEWGYDSDEDGGPATEALLNWPADVALDANGNLYIADEYNNRIRMVDAQGIITTVAGMRRPPPPEVSEEEEDEVDVGDGGPATSALLHRPTGVAVDKEGNLYIADRRNHRIRQVNAEGIITTIAGMADEGFSGDEGPATSAQLDGPGGVAVDEAGYVFIADRGNNRIRQIDPDGVITTLAGGEEGGDGSDMEGQLAAPRDVAVDSDGNLYVADTGNHQIHVIDDTGMVTRVAGAEGLGDGGPATKARIFEPTGLAIVDGAIYITDTGNNRIRMVDTSSGIITTLAGSGERGDAGDGGPALEAQLNGPAGIAVDAEGNVYFSDRWNNRVRKVDTDGIITTVAGTGERGRFGDRTAIGDGGPAIEARLREPTGVAFDAAGNLYITDPGNHRIRRVDTQGTITTVAGSGERSFSGDEGPADQAQLTTPTGFEIDVDGNIYVADFVWPRNRIRKIDTAGIITTIAETASLGGLTVDLEGNVYIVESTVGRILKLTPAGVLSIIAGSNQPGYSGDGGPATLAQLDIPKGIEVDEDGNVYFADSENNRIRKLTPDR